MAVAAGAEVESAAGAPPLLTTGVLGAAITGRHALTEVWGVSYQVGAVRQGDLYARAGGRLGVHRTF